jgi:hypothetical protein
MHGDLWKGNILLRPARGMAMQLEHFPMQRFAQMVQACHATLHDAIH